jgi:RNA-directed DNA polymerase
VRNPDEKLGDRTQGRTYLPDHLIRVNDAAKRSRQTRFTALLHHVDVEALERAFRRLRRKAAPGVDGMTVETYEGRLADNLRELCDRVHSGRYNPLPVRRTYIPKADGGKRPLGILVLEDKIVQGAVAEVLSAIYEADFLDCSYGFRPGRSAHQALRTIHDAVISERVKWVFEADIRKFYDSIDHEWLMRIVEHRIADPRILRLIRQWLEVGVLENGVYAETVEGTPQGAGISPLLANIFLHYALDLWVLQWMRRAATGPMRLVRYADDFLLTFERRADADRMATALAERLAKFGLRLHEDKTRLIEFGRFAVPIPVKPPVCNGMIAPRDSWMMPPPCNEMIPPGAPRLLAERVSSPCGVAGQAVLDCLPRVRRRLSPVNSMRCALWTRRSRMASA